MSEMQHLWKDPSEYARPEDDPINANPLFCDKCRHRIEYGDGYYSFDDNGCEWIFCEDCGNEIVRNHYHTYGEE